MATPKQSPAQASARPAGTDPNDPAHHSAAPAASRTDWVDLPIGFDPYWTPAVGKSFVARVAEFDARDPEFIRIRMIASEALMCQKGDTEHAEDVQVEVGGFFTISVYAGIAKELMYHYQSGIAPEVMISVLRQDKVKAGKYAGKPVWIFSAKCRPEDQRKLAVGRADYFKQLAAAQTSSRPQLAPSTPGPS